MTGIVPARRPPKVARPGSEPERIREVAVLEGER